MCMKTSWGVESDVKSTKISKKICSIICKFSTFPLKIKTSGHQKMSQFFEMENGIHFLFECHHCILECKKYLKITSKIS